MASDHQEEFAAHTVIVRTFGSLGEAELAAANLRAHGIRCSITADDAGGMYPTSVATSGVRLLVRQQDAATAKELLAVESSNIESEEDSEPPFGTVSRPNSKPPSWRSLGHLVTGIILGVLLCLLYQWTSKMGTKIYRYDNNDDGKPDETHVRRNGHTVEVTRDRNFDGYPDEWLHYEHGLVVGVEFDENFDGKPDLWWTYTNGIPVDSRWDTDFNGTPDVFSTYRVGLALQIREMDWKPNGTNIVTKHQTLRNGVLYDEARDLDGDGRFDQIVRFDAFENPVKTNAFNLLSSPSR